MIFFILCVSALLATLYILYCRLHEVIENQNKLKQDYCNLVKQIKTLYEDDLK